MRRLTPQLQLRAVLSVVACGAAVALPGAAAAQAPAEPSPVPSVVPAGHVLAIHRDDGSLYTAVTQTQFARFFDAALSQKQQRPIKHAIPLVAPDFIACVQSKRSLTGAPRPRTQRGRLRVCRRTYGEVSNTALRQLLNLHWVVAEGERRGIAITPSRLARERRKVVRSQFKGERGLRAFMRQSGLHEEDVHLNLLSQVVQEALLRQVSAAVPKHRDVFEQQTAQQEAINAFRTEFLQRWHASTTCAAEYALLPACTGADEDALAETAP